MVGAAPRVSYDAWSSRLHGVLMFFATCPVALVRGHFSASNCAQVLLHRGGVR